MISRIRIVLLLVLATLPLLLYGCKRDELSQPGPATALQPKASEEIAAQSNRETKKTPADVVTRGLFKERIAPLRIEEQAQALPLWRKFREQKPVLLVFSAKVIRPVLQAVQGEVDRLLSSANTDELMRRIARPVPDRLLDADMGVAAALRQGYVSRVIWVVPLEDGAVLLPLEKFKENYREVAGGWGDEIDSFHDAWDGAFSGRLAGIPVDVVTIDRLPKVAEPVLVHIDSGFFAATYRNEVKTPLNAKLDAFCKKVAAVGYQALQVSISSDNMNYEIPLTMRFLGNEIAVAVADPALFAQPRSEMKLRGEMMYLDSFYQPELIQQKGRELVRLDPQNADSHYRLYRALRQAHQLDEGLASLEKAITLDPLYADEYIELVKHATEKKQWEAALAMIDSAIRARPDNPLVRLRKAQLLVALKRGREAAVILKELKTLPWSEVYYPRISEEIERLLIDAQKSK